MDVWKGSNEPESESEELRKVKTMQDHEIDDLVGIYEKDGGVKCRDCMKAKDWRDLKEENIITVDDIQDGDEWLYCDYCEKKL